MARRVNRLSLRLMRLFPWALFPRLLLPLLLVAAWSGTIVSGYRLYQDWRYNHRAEAVSLQQLAANTSLVTARQPGQQEQRLLLLDAWRLAQAGHMQQALALYARVGAGQDRELVKAAHYNSANLYLRQAMELLDRQGLAAWDTVSPLLALSRFGYQRALRIDPGYYDAKYNLELVLRLAPDIHSSVSKQKEEDEEQDVGERPTGWPSIPGFPRGMP